MSLLTAEEARNISAAISEAERKTSGEIVAVVAKRSDDYYFIPMLWAALAALAAPIPALFYVTWVPQQIYLLQLAVFAVGLLLAAWPVTRLALVPHSIKRARAHRHAVEQFLAQNLHTTKGRTGVLIFVSAAERFAEVIADEGIYEKVPPETWTATVDALTAQIRAGQAAAGFIEAIERCGTVLAEHFPPGTADRNELPNHLIVLE